MSIPMDYHLLFMMLVFIFFVITLFLLFIVENTAETTTAALVLAMLNIIICIIVSYGFGMIGVFGADSTGTLVENVFSDLYFMGWIFLIMAYINIMFTIYCGYLYWTHPWKENRDPDMDGFFF